MARAPAKGKAKARPAAVDRVVSLDELATVISVTPETLRRHLKQAPADADWLIERGRPGVGYKIAVDGAVAWWNARSSRSSGGEDEAKQALLAEWRLTALGDAGDDEGLGLTGKQRLDEFRAAQAELNYRQLIGELCVVGEIEDETANAVIELRRQLQGVGPEIQRAFGLAREVATAIEDAIAKRLIAFVAKLDGDGGTGGE